MEIKVISSVDGSAQPSLFYEAKEKSRPLLVGLHTWSADRFNQVEKMLPLAEKNGWNLLLPEFRGPNLSTNPISNQACGSDIARADILDAIEYVKKKAKVGNVYFDDSRAWALYTTEKPAAEKTPGYCRKYGAYRDYLGGGIRGTMCCNLTGELNALFTSALSRIESIINDETDGLESWEQNTGVLL